MENKNEKSLNVVNNSFFGRIKDFFKNLFSRNKNVENLLKDDISNNIDSKNDWLKEAFGDNTNQVNKIYKVQSLYRSGKIKEGELSEEEKKQLCLLYDKQIEHLKRENDKLQRKLEQSSDLYNIQIKLENGEISEEDLSIEQINLLSLLYDKQIENLELVNEIRKKNLLELRKKCKQ